jgi:hypothetical protein
MTNTSTYDPNYDSRQWHLELLRECRSVIFEEAGGEGVKSDDANDEGDGSERNRDE